MKAALILTNRLAREMSEPAAAINASGREYGQALGELDPGIHIKLDLIEERGEERTAEDAQALDEMKSLVSAARQGQKALEEMLDSAAPISNLSRSLRAPLSEMRAGLLGVIDGNAVIEEWGRRAIEIKAEDDTEGDDEESASAGNEPPV